LLKRNDDQPSKPQVEGLLCGLPKRRLMAAIFFGAIAAIPFGLGGFTFMYAEGLSYLSPDPKACVNCHIMRPEYDSWQKASHHNVAVCVDCHLPHSLLPKYIAKADNGFRHSKGFTLQDFHEPIMITEKNKRILQENCLACHDQMVHDLVPGATFAIDVVYCVHCHRSVGHGDSVGLGDRDRGVREEIIKKWAIEQ